MLNALSLTASWDAASTTKSTGLEDKRWTFSTISGLFFNLLARDADFSLSSSKIWVNFAGIMPVSIAIAICVPIEPQPSRPLFYYDIF